MSIISTPTARDVEKRVKASVLDTLLEHLAMDKVLVAACLDGTGQDVRIASRVGIVVIARVQKVFGIKDLVNPKKLRPEQATSVGNVVALLVTELVKRSG